MQLNKSYLKNTLVPILMYGSITGIITGALVWGYNFVAEIIVEKSNEVYAFFRENPTFFPILLGTLAFLSILAWLITKYAPSSCGSGVPYMEGVMKGLLPLRWLKSAFAMVIGSFISFFAGLPLGCEGPSVFLGGCIGRGVNEIGSKHKISRPAWRRQIVTAGASAGFAVAFNAPLAGILFALEEGHKRFSPMLLVPTAITVIFAILTSNTLSSLTGHGITNVIFTEFSTAVNPSLNESVYFLILGIVVGLVAFIYSTALNGLNDFFAKIKLPRVIKFFLAFLLAGVVGFFFTDAIGGGASLIRKIALFDLEWKILLILFSIKLVQLIFCSASEVTGGYTIPVMALGSLLGGIMSKLFVLIGMNPEYHNLIVLTSMCAMLGSVARAPIMSIVLVVEMTRVTLHLWAACLAIILAYFIIELFRVEPIYEKSLENMLKRRNLGKRSKFAEYEMEVEQNSFAVGRTIHDILWPANTLVLKIKNIDKHGNVLKSLHKESDRKIKIGDRFIIQAETTDFNETYQELCYILKNPDFVKSMTDKYVQEEEEIKLEEISLFSRKNK